MVMGAERGGRDLATALAPDVLSNEIESWSRAVAGGRTPVSDKLANLFPFAPVTEHFQSRGRHNAEATAVSALDAADRVFRSTAALAEPVPPSSQWLIATWLPMLLDVHRESCTYASYVGTHMLEGLTAGHPRELVMAALLADLLQHESSGVSDCTRLQRRRLTALANCVLQYRPCTVDRVDLSSIWPLRKSPLHAAHEDAAIVEACRRLAGRVLASIPVRLRDVVRLMVLPVTDELDEFMFLRVLQLFETVFAGMVGNVYTARAALEADDCSSAVSELDAARLALSRAIPLFRVLATMPPESFARIRVMTTGASGLQSESFKRIELVAARQPAARLGSPGYAEANVAVIVTAESGRPTIDELARRSLDPALLSAMTDLDEEWLQWKRTHWAVASRIIGASPGTGGTAGAAYLRHHMSGPLFPLLHD
jgi:tryptophan 2,3-dioxygenase